MLKKIAKISGIVLLALILIAFLIPIFFKGKILAIARKQINDHVNARVDFKDVNLSLFRHFPGVALGLEELHVVGIDDFSKDTLISADEIDVAVNLLSLFGSGPMKINSISVDNPRIHALVHADGKANWSISKPDTATASASPDSAGSFHMELQSYSIKNAYLYYQDIPGDMSCEISGLNHSGSGDFTSDLFTLKTKTSADAVSFTYTKVPYLVDAKTALGADITVDNKINKYSFKTDDIAVNELKLSTEGFFQFVNDSTYGMDVKFSAPSTDFKTLLSLIPAVYKNDFNKIQTSGKALFNGFVKGEYNSAKIPAYQVNLNVDNGFFKYPDLPEPVKNIGIVMKIDNPDGITDHTVVDISKGHIEFGNDPFDFRLLLKNPLTDQYIDAAVKGRLNLSQVTKFVKLSSGTTLSGLVNADAQAKGNVASVMKQKPGNFSANGVVGITGLNYSSKDFPAPVKNTSVQINFANTDGTADHTSVTVPSGHVEIGNDPIDFNLLLKNPVSNLYFEGSAKGKFNLASVGQFTTLAPGTSVAGIISADMNFKGNKSSIDAKQYEKIYTAGSLGLSNLLYKSKDYPDGISVPQAAFTFNPQNITLNSASAVYLNTHYSANGTVDNVIGYALKDEPISGSLTVNADDIDLNKLMGSMPPSSADTAKTTAGTQPAASQPFAVPKNVAFILNAAVSKLKYDKVVYNNVRGTIAIKDESVALKDVTMDALDGKIGASGLYSTKNSKKNPDISFAYDLSGIDVQKTFLAFNTVQQLMPAGRYVTGKVNSHMTMSGSLTQQMSPDLKTLTGKGTLDMIDGALKNFTPLEKLSSLLNIEALKNTALKDIKLSYDFANGRVLVKPFKVKAAGINMEIAGTHGFDQTIDYVIGMKMPRSILGGAANSLVNGLAKQAADKGIPVNISDSINMNVRMGGTMSNPQLKSGLNSSGGAGGSIGDAVKQQATVFAKQAVDSAKTVVNEKKNELKDSAVAIKNQALKDLSADLGKAISGQKDTAGGKPLQSTQKNAEDALKNTLNGLFQKKKKTP